MSALHVRIFENLSMLLYSDNFGMLGNNPNCNLRLPTSLAESIQYSNHCLEALVTVWWSLASTRVA
eukprot:4694666-Amphidinium_carterae.1